MDLDKWWLAVRADYFDTRTTNSFGPSPLLSEVGRSGTFAANYAPETWIRLSGEYLVINSTRQQRILDGDPAHLVEQQLQFSVRIASAESLFSESITQYAAQPFHRVDFNSEQAKYLGFALGRADRGGPWRASCAGTGTR